MPDINYKLTKDDVEFLARVRSRMDYFADNESRCTGLKPYAEELGALLNRVIDLDLFDGPSEDPDAG